jgi:hypothetical protein
MILKLSLVPSFCFKISQRGITNRFLCFWFFFFEWLTEYVSGEEEIEHQADNQVFKVMYNEA